MLHSSDNFIHRIGLHHASRIFAYLEYLIIFIYITYKVAVLVGAIIAQSAALTGATLHFIAGRYLFKEKLYEMASKYPTFKAVNKAIEAEVCDSFD